MLVLAWWSKTKPLPAILIATAIYARRYRSSAPSSTPVHLSRNHHQGRDHCRAGSGIKGALSARTENG
jgi:hypothetical protein